MDRTQPTQRMRGLGGAAALIAAVLVLILPAHAQDASDEGQDSRNEVFTTCPWFGVGGVVRPGEWAGLRLSIKDSSDKPREVLVRISMPDPDGDHMLYEGRITTNPGVALPLWVYLYLPAQFKRDQVLTVNCFAAVESAGKGGAAFEIGRLLGTSRIKPRSEASMANRFDGLMGIVGSRDMELRKYAAASDNRGQALATGHERMYTIEQLTPDTLPDRWYGLRQFDILVWNEPPAGALGTDKAQAVREWVQHGGHLVVVLPRVGQTWTDEANNPLYDITPRVTVDRHEGTDLAPIGQLLTKDPKTVFSTTEVLQTFRPLEGVLPGEAVCVLGGMEREAGKGPEWLVVRRLVGVGMVDLVGVDVASGWMKSRSLPDPELFWHRILGRRGELWSQGEYNAKVNGRGGYSDFRESPVTVDRDIGPEIGMSGSAGAGVLMGLVVFVAYWLVAGPLGYAVLRKTNRARHAWVAFVAAAGFFTALAWGGATAVRPAQLKAQHLSILDHVYSGSMGGSVERSRSWVSLLVPQYGQATVSVGDPATKATSSFHNIIAPWDQEGATSGGFPDARGYRVDSKSPDQYTVPTRSTVKQFVVDWAGGSKLKMIRPLAIEGKDDSAKITLREDGGRTPLRGLLAHDLPGPLDDVVIVLVHQQSLINGSGRELDLRLAGVKAVAAVLPSSWDPGVERAIDLSTVEFAGPQTEMNAYLQSITNSLGRSDQGEALGVDRGTLWKRLLGVTFFPLLEPPDTSDDRVNRQAQKLAQRTFTHGMDLAAWLTEPCVIVIGQLREKTPNACPAPIFVDTGGGFREVKTEGRTMIRWIYPLAASPPGFGPRPAPKQDDSLPAERSSETEENPTPAPPPKPKTKRRG